MSYSSSIDVAKASLSSTITMAIVMLIVSYVVEAIAFRACMKKAGVEGWKAFIPVYNLYVMYKTVGLNGFLSVFRAIYIIAEIIIVISTMSFMGKLDDLVSESKKAEKSIISAIEVSNSAKKVEKEVEEFTGNLLSVTILSYVGSIGAFIVGIFFAIKMRTAYNLPGGFIAGLIIVPVIFYFIVGFGKYEYQGANADPVQNA
ncbi:MAG: hypothetical protein J6J36_08980 [Clostridia bacterium]|nr:hypothetical protein [Clostridia bacterium]